MKREESVDYNIKVAWHSISRMYNMYGMDFDISTSTGFVLLNIDVESGTPATKIAPLLGLESRSLTRLLKSMEERNWVYREPDPNDGRSVRIFLTDLGKEKREISRQAVLRFNSKVAESVQPEKLKIFFQVMNKIRSVSEDKDLIEVFLKDLKLELNA